jgi:hypothetical protein
MIGTRAPSLFGLVLLLPISCAPDPAELSPSALVDDDVVNYIPADRSVVIRAAADQPEVMEMPEDILTIAIAEEGKTLEQVGVSTGFPLSTYAGAAPGGWCSEFVAWSYWRGGCPFTGQRGTYSWMIGGSTQIRQWFVTNSRFVYQTDAEWATYEPQPGDYIRYNNPEGGHSGIVRYADGTTLYTVEGNVNSKVMLRTLRNYKTAYADPEDGIDGFGVMTDEQCTSTTGTGGAAGTGGSTGPGGSGGSGGATGVGGQGGTSGGSTGAGGTAGSAGSGGSAGAGGSAGSAGTGGRGGGAGGSSGTGGVAGRRGSGGAIGSGGRAGGGGTSGGGGGAGGTAGTTGAAGTAGAGGVAGRSGAGGAADASGGSGGRAGGGGSAGSGGTAGVSGTGGSIGAGGTSESSSPTTSSGGNNSASTGAASSGCSCSTGRGPHADSRLWLVGFAFLLAGRRRRRH